MAGGFLECKKCGGIYELQPGESKEDFESCQCGGELKYVAYPEKKINKQRSYTIGYNQYNYQTKASILIPVLLIVGAIISILKCLLFFINFGNYNLSVFIIVILGISMSVFIIHRYLKEIF